jgi:hypothetical protein
MNLIYVRKDGFIGKKITNATHIVDDMEGFVPVKITRSCNIEVCYYENGEIKLKEQMDIITPTIGNVDDIIIITGIPDDSEVMWPDRVKTFESGSVSFTANSQGLYVFYISHAHYITRKVIIDVT